MTATAPTGQRVDPFSADDDIDLSDFARATPEARKPVDRAALDALGKATGFDRSMLAPVAADAPVVAPSAPASPLLNARRRYQTGRDTQLNIKCSQHNKDLFLRLAEQHGGSNAVFFEKLLLSYEKSQR